MSSKTRPKITPKINTAIVGAFPGFDMLIMRRGEIDACPVIAWQITVCENLVGDIRPIAFAFAVGDSYALKLPDGRVTPVAHGQIALTFHPSIEEWRRSVVCEEWNGAGRPIAGLA